jgi:glycosyltransferase involved in cell wall biosynthesis
MAPTVSIGIPVYNGAPFLRETLECIAGQTWRDTEIVISDNASTDETPAICRAFADADPRVRYHRAEVNRGSAWNFNQVIRLSHGEYFKLANADDLCDRTLVAKCLAVLEAEPAVVACFGRTSLIDEAGRRLRDYDDGLHLRHPDPEVRFMAVLSRLGLVNMTQGVTRLEPLRRTGLMGRYVGSDMVLVAELALHGEFHELEERLFHRRMHEDAFSGLASPDAQVAYMVPTQRGGSGLYYWRHYAGYCRAALRSPLPASRKAALLARIARKAVGVRASLLGEVRGELAARLRGRGPAE